MRKRHIHVLLLSALALGGCDHLQMRISHTPRLSEGEVLSIANRAAEAAGADLLQFKKPEAHFEYVSKDYNWSVFYDGLKPTIGNHFLVIVSDTTRNTDIIGGL
jgi:hypothetical protein